MVFCWNCPRSGPGAAAPPVPKVDSLLPAMIAFVAERILFPTRVGLRCTASMIGRPSAVVSSHCTRFCPAATKRFAASTARMPLRNMLGRPCTFVDAFANAVKSEGSFGSRGSRGPCWLPSLEFAEPPEASG